MVKKYLPNCLMFAYRSKSPIVSSFLFSSYIESRVNTVVNIFPSADTSRWPVPRSLFGIESGRRNRNWSIDEELQKDMWFHDGRAISLVTKKIYIYIIYIYVCFVLIRFSLSRASRSSSLQSVASISHTCCFLYWRHTANYDLCHTLVS